MDPCLKQKQQLDYSAVEFGTVSFRKAAAKVNEAWHLIRQFKFHMAREFQEHSEVGGSAVTIELSAGSSK